MRFLRRPRAALWKGLSNRMCSLSYHRQLAHEDRACSCLRDLDRLVDACQHKRPPRYRPSSDTAEVRRGSRRTSVRYLYAQLVAEWPAHAGCRWGKVLETGELRGWLPNFGFAVRPNLIWAPTEVAFQVGQIDSLSADPFRPYSRTTVVVQAQWVARTPQRR